MTEHRSLLTCRAANQSLRTWLGLWMSVALLLPLVPARAQQSQPETSAPAEKEGSSSSASLEELLQEEVPTASVGSFGYRLRRYGIHPYIHGALAVDLWRWRLSQGDRPAHQGFDLRDAHLYFGADILDLIVPELFMELESNNPGFSELFLRYAQVDVRLAEQHLVMRAGLFLVPFGTYNTESFPRFITKLPERPNFFGELIPVAWREVGVQAFGGWEWKPGLSLSYALYVTNGLEQLDDEPADGVAEGGSLADLENVFEEINNSSKSIGARVRMELIPGLAIGLSGYTGPYTSNGKRQLSLAGMDVYFQRGKLSLEMETAVARQEITGGALTKWGYYALAAYRVHPMVEPVLAIDEYHLDGAPEDDARSLWAAANFFPFPDQIPNAQFKIAYNRSFHPNEVSRSRFALQFAVGF